MELSKCSAGTVVLKGKTNGCMGKTGRLFAGAAKVLPTVIPVASSMAIDVVVGAASGALVGTTGIGRLGGFMVVLPGDASKPVSKMTFALVYARYWPLGLIGLMMRAVSSVIAPEIHVSAATLMRIAPTTHPQWV